MGMARRKSFIATAIICGIAILGAVAYFTLSSSPATQAGIVIEEIPGSKFHSPDGTWWGYNQSKIVRFQDYVFSYYIDNQDSNSSTVSRLTLLKKRSDDAWQKGASFPTSRPGNILVDSTGVLHAFVFEPTNAAINDSWGKLIHYSLPQAASGDITTFAKETVIENTGREETVNIRIGAAMGEDDTMAIAFGLPFGVPPYSGQSEHLYIKKPQEVKWQHLIAGQNLGHDFYYPFVVAQHNEFHLLPVQDDYANDGNPATYDNIYQKINLFSFVNGQWDNVPVADLSHHPMARKRPRLLEQEDLLIDSGGTVHLVYKEFLDPQYGYKATAHKHVQIAADGTQEENSLTGRDDLNWVRLFTIKGDMYYFASSFEAYYWKKADAREWSTLDMPADAKGMYPYIAKGNGATYLDVLLLAADSKTYEDGSHKNYYVRIPLAYFR